MNKKLLIPLTLGLLGHSCQNISDQTQKNLNDTLHQKQSVEKTTPAITYDIALPYPQQQMIKQVVDGYFSQYPCDMKNLTISAEEISDQVNEQTLAHAKPHTIYLNIEYLDDASIKNTIIHELFHTLKPDTLTIISPYKLQDGYSIIGYHGLSVVVKKDNQQTQFGLFEDAAAEALATLYDPLYRVPNIYYANIGSLMIKLIKRGYITTEDLINCQTTNNISLFCNILLQKTTTSQDIEKLMIIFNKVYATEDDMTEKAIDVIEQMRK